MTRRLCLINRLGDTMNITPIAGTPSPIEKQTQPVSLDPKKTPQAASTTIQIWEHAPWPPVMESPAVVRDAFAVWSLYQ